MAKWLAVNGRAVYGAAPLLSARAGEGERDGKGKDGKPAVYTQMEWRLPRRSRKAGHSPAEVARTAVLTCRN